MKNTKTHTVEIHLNEPSLTYSLYSFELGVHSTVHHHDLDWYKTVIEKDANKRGFNVEFSEYKTVSQALNL